MKENGRSESREKNIQTLTDDIQKTEKLEGFWPYFILNFVFEKF